MEYLFLTGCKSFWFLFLSATTNTIKLKQKQSNTWSLKSIYVCATYECTRTYTYMRNRVEMRYHFSQLYLWCLYSFYETLTVVPKKNKFTTSYESTYLHLANFAKIWRKANENIFRQGYTHLSQNNLNFSSPRYYNVVNANFNSLG